MSKSTDIDFIEQRKQAKQTKVLDMLSDGMTDDEICKDMRIGWGEYNALRIDAIGLAVEQVRNMKTEQVYAEYVLNQKAILADLKRGSAKADRQKQYSAFASIAKTRSDIYDKIVKLGQEFGILERKPERKEVSVAGMIVTRMDSSELRGVIINELKGLSSLMEMYSDKNIIDVEVGPLHRSLPEPVEIQTQGHGKRSRVHGGRRKEVE